MNASADGIAPRDGTRPVKLHSAWVPTAALLALQLHACGYSDRQIAHITGWSPWQTAGLLASATRQLAASDLRGAVLTARQRGLIRVSFTAMF
jgi:hypothetical protein